MLTPVAHIDLRKSPRIFEKTRNDTNVIFGAWGKMIREKKPAAKTLVKLDLRTLTCLGGDMGDIDPQVSRGARGPL